MYVGPNRERLWLGGGFISLLLFEKEVGGWKNKKKNRRERSCLRLIWGGVFATMAIMTV